MRIYLTGHLLMESSGRVIEEKDLPARQGRLAFSYLTIHRARPVPRIELSEALWGDDQPETWGAGLSALLSRLRRLFRSVLHEGDIETLSGSVSLYLPDDSWIDLDVARGAIDQAEGALRSGQYSRAWGEAAVAVSIFERGFLPGEELPWVIHQREQLHADLVRAWECLAETCLATNDPTAALRYASECVVLEPYRESGYERVMRAHLAGGNRAEALRVYDRLRTLLTEEFGVDPSEAVERTYLKALGV